MCLCVGVVIESSTLRGGPGCTKEGHELNVMAMRVFANKTLFNLHSNTFP